MAKFSLMESRIEKGLRRQAALKMLGALGKDGESLRKIESWSESAAGFVLDLSQKMAHVEGYSPSEKQYQWLDKLYKRFLAERKEDEENIGPLLQAGFTRERALDMLSKRRAAERRAKKRKSAEKED